MPKKKVYCENCKYLRYDIPFIGARCNYIPTIKIDTWLHQMNVVDYQKPWNRNANNDCKAFEKK